MRSVRDSGAGEASIEPSEGSIGEPDATDELDAADWPDVGEALPDDTSDAGKERGDAVDDGSPEDEDASPDAGEADSEPPLEDAGDSGVVDDEGDAGEAMLGDSCPDVPMIHNGSDSCESSKST